MSQITLHIHPETVGASIAEGNDGERMLAAISRQALQVVQACGWHIAYAPIFLPKGSGCAMSAHRDLRGLVINVDRPGTLISGRGVVTMRQCSPNNKTSPARRR